jgi:hypothetical protein
MTLLDDLEDQLRSSFDAETLSVYADLLQSDADPRGEIITADLELAALYHRELKARRDELVTQCFGELHGIATCRFGFLDVRVTSVGQLGALAVLMVCAPRSYIRWLRLGLEPRDLPEGLRLVAQHRHDLLVELDIDAATGAGPDADRALCADVAAAASRLDVLVVRGRNVLAGFSHSRMRALRVVGYAAITDPGPFPAVESLHLQLESPPASRAVLPPASVIASNWHARRFPALRTLDLSGNIESGVSAYHFLAVTELRTALHEVRMPRLRTDEDRAHLELVTRELPHLRVMRQQ